MTLELLKKSLKEAPIVKKGQYHYIIHPITDGVPYINPALLDEVVYELQKRIEKCGSINKIVTIEAMGIPVATKLSSNMDIPFTIIRKRSYGLKDEVSVEQVTGYSKSKLYINGLKKDDRIVIVDDVLSTGGTLSAVIEALKDIGVIIKGVFIVVNKGSAAKKIMEKYSVEISSLINIDVAGGRLLLRES